MDMSKVNRIAWNKKVEDKAVYTKPVTKEVIKKCKAGDWSITVTTEKAVPKNWFPKPLTGKKVLCLASGGGQQGPVLAAAGADVTVLDISEKQLEQDSNVAKENGLSLKTYQGDMTNLKNLSDETYDLIVHPVSNLFVEDIAPVWKEAARVLKKNGILIAGFTNPLLFIFDDEQEMKGNLKVTNAVPSSSIANLNEQELEQYLQSKRTIEFSHTLEEQIQGQIDAGFAITGFYEDDFGGNRMIDKYIKTFIATRAIKLSS